MMNIDAWREAVTQRLHTLAREIHAWTPDLLYGALCSASLLPVVTAAHQGDFTAVAALTGVVGAVGGNLISGQIQAWKDRSEEDLAAELTANARDDSAWRDALDKLLVEFQAPQTVQAVLSEADRDWFARALKGSLAHVKSGLTVTNEGVWVVGNRNVTVAGGVRNSTIVTGDGNTVTETGGGAYVAGDVEIKGGDFVGRDKYVFSSVEMVRIESAVFEAPPDPGQVAPKELLWTYLNRVVMDTGTLDLAGIDRKAMGDREDARLELAAVYTALDTIRSAREERSRALEKSPSPESEAPEEERQAAPAFVAHYDYAALLGDPGGGKSTFVNFLALCLAGEMLGLERVNIARLGEEWTLGPRLPVRVVLRDLAVQLPDLPAEGTLWAYVVKSLGEIRADFAPLLRKHLLEEGGLLILDGLDEVPEAHARRDQVKEAVLAFQHDFPKVRIVLTSRTYAYQRQEWRLPGFAEAVLAPFEEEQINAFVERWYQHMAQVRRTFSATEARRRAQLLQETIARNRHLRELAARPLLLTLMASLHAWRGGKLPEDRGQLYEESVDLLLDRWETPKTVHDAQGRPVVQAESAAEWMRCSQAHIRRALEKLAYNAHKAQAIDDRGAADIPEAQLVAAFLAATGDKDLKPARVVDYIRDRAGLLNSRGEGIYAFPHRTFQEYLAARHLAETEFPRLLIALLKEDPERWREALLLAGGMGTPFAAWGLADQLCPTECGADVADAATDADWWAALLAGQLLTERGLYLDLADDSPDRHKLTRVVSWLAALVARGQLPPVDRVAAGRALSLLGDPRPGVGVRNGLPDIAWRPVEAGPFIMGSDKQVDPWAYKDEEPQFTCTLITKPYRISRYPVTVLQYQAFVSAGGYTRRAYWTEAGWAWRKQNQISGPKDYSKVFQTPNHPRVGVSWYEAVAYCNWLSEQWGYAVRLPTEAEWERAARHTDGRIYPWNGEFDVRCCNMGKTGIGATSAVGAFPAGNAQCGATDMSGNVWEWCSTKRVGDYEGYEKRADDDLAGGATRVVRGGAFHFNRVNVRCACRDLYYAPYFRDYSIGFRVVAPGF
ncbi:MAG: SUMF1/EgtB/PvdO family nonheme iron enzyme [Caldilineaceae bacterium]|nr:SUMF1/EgtB/PvdO family nonheme iron enzyme [Caldilineaceae bacterium]